LTFWARRFLAQMATYPRRHIPLYSPVYGGVQCKGLATSCLCLPSLSRPPPPSTTNPTTPCSPYDARPRIDGFGELRPSVRLTAHPPLLVRRRARRRSVSAFPGLAISQTHRHTISISHTHTLTHTLSLKRTRSLALSLFLVRRRARRHSGHGASVMNEVPLYQTATKLAPPAVMQSARSHWLLT